MHFQDLGYPLPQTIGTQNYLFFEVFQQPGYLGANISRIKHDIDNWATALEITRGPGHDPKISRTLVHKLLK